MLVPIDNETFIKEYTKKDKYKDQEIEIESMWHIKTTIVSVNNGSTGYG